MEALIALDQESRDKANRRSLRTSFEASRFVVERIEAGESVFDRDDLDALSRAVYDLNHVRSTLILSRSPDLVDGIDLADVFDLTDRGWRLALRISRERLATRAAEGDE